jgi:hypothetical protein
MVKRVSKGEDGKYHIKGKTYEQLIGSRAQVYHGTAYKTAGDLKKSDIMMNKHGRIVSVKKHATAKREKRLVKAGYLTKKGKFGFVRSTKRGGGGMMEDLEGFAEGFKGLADDAKSQLTGSVSAFRPNMARSASGGRRHTRRHRKSKGGDVA